MIHVKSACAVAVCLVAMVCSWATVAAQPKAELAITVAKDSFKAGDEIVVHVRFKNIGDRIIVQDWIRGGGIDAHYTSMILWNGYAPVRSRWENRMGSSIERKIKPGAEKEDTFVLNDQFRDMTKEGVYTVQVRWGRAKSNIIHVIVRK